MLVVEHSEPHDGPASKAQVEQLVEKALVEDYSWKAGEEAVPEDGENEQHVLVEHVGYQVTIFPVSFPTMHKHKRLQETKLADGVVTRSRSLLTFEA